MYSYLTLQALTRTSHLGDPGSVPSKFCIAFLVERVTFEQDSSPSTSLFLPVIISNLLYTFAIIEAEV